jgi:choline-sulfatase
MHNPDVRTPNMDRLAARGVVLERHMTTFPKCVPARCSLVTGRYCHTDGWRTVQQTLEPEQPNLLRHLQQQGYQTAVFGKNHCWSSRDWDRLDYESYRGEASALRVESIEGIDAKHDGNTRRPLDLEKGWDYAGTNTRHAPDEGYAAQAAAFFEHWRDPDRPFFMQLNFESPHAVYAVEEPWFSMYDRDAIHAFPHDLPDPPPLPVKAQRERRTGNEPNEAAARELQATYYGMISKVDHLLGWVLDALDRAGLTEQTTILFWSDHGDYAGQHTLVEKWDTHLADVLLHVPCVLIDPSLPAGERVASVNDTASLAPTLLDLLGLDPLPMMHGGSLLDQIAGREGPRPAFADGGHDPSMRAIKAGEPKPVGSDGSRLGKSETYWACPDSMARCQSVRTDTHRLVVRETGEHELYANAEDPHEMRNRWDDPSLADTRAELLQMLAEWNLRTLSEKPVLDGFTV